MRSRRTRLEITESNRRGVLEAARGQFLDKGFHGASLDAIAEEAGFSKGVVYSQFGSKNELFLALLAERIEQRHERLRELAAALSGPEGLEALARDATGASADSAAWQALLLEFRAHAARDAALNDRYLALHRRTIGYVSEILADLFERGGSPPPLPLAMLATLFLAIGTGLTAELLVDPGLDVRAMASHVARALGAMAPQAPAARRIRSNA
jgi:AcrR family transcriptional regulator